MSSNKGLVSSAEFFLCYAVDTFQGLYWEKLPIKMFAIELAPFAVSKGFFFFAITCFFSPDVLFPFMNLNSRVEA